MTEPHPQPDNYVDSALRFLDALSSDEQSGQWPVLHNDKQIELKRFVEDWKLSRYIALPDITEIYASHNAAPEQPSTIPRGDCFGIGYEVMDAGCANCNVTERCREQMKRLHAQELRAKYAPCPHVGIFTECYNRQAGCKYQKIVATEDNTDITCTYSSHLEFTMLDDAIKAEGL